jgi:hypothetical protein
MIGNDSELAVARKQLQRIEEALESLRKDVLPKNQRNYEVLSEGYKEQIQSLKSEVELYLASRAGSSPSVPPGVSQPANALEA